MNTSVLYPPNCQSLSGGVIRDVMQRARPLSYERLTSQNGANAENTWLHAAKRYKTSAPPRRSVNESNDTPIAIAVTEKNSAISRRQNLSPSSTNLSARRTVGSVGDQRIEKALKARGSGQTALTRRRQQSRENMARYRQKMLGRVETLEGDTQKLRKETYKLELQRKLLDIGISIKTTPWNVVSEHFRLFR